MASYALCKIFVNEYQYVIEENIKKLQHRTISFVLFFKMTKYSHM